MSRGTTAVHYCPETIIVIAYTHSLKRHDIMIRRTHRVIHAGAPLSPRCAMNGSITGPGKTKYPPVPPPHHHHLPHLALPAVRHNLDTRSPRGTWRQTAGREEARVGEGDVSEWPVGRHMVSLRFRWYHPTSLCLREGSSKRDFEDSVGFALPPFSHFPHTHTHTHTLTHELTYGVCGCGATRRWRG